MAEAWANDRAAPFYRAFGWAALTVSIAGFTTTYFMPMARGSFAAPWVVHLHGVGAFLWLLLLLAQASLVGRSGVALHRRLGLAAIPLALVIWSSGILTAASAARRDLSALGTAATSSLGATAIGLSLFLGIVTAAVALRRRPSWHKRLILLATIQLLWPAFFRLRHLLPMIPQPDIWLALVAPYSLVLLAGLRDWLRHGRLHPVWLFVGPLLVIEQSLEVVFFDQGPLRAWGQLLYRLLG